MSLISVSRAAAEASATAAYRRCWASSGVPPSSASMPTTPFSGVRISWLMLARNSLLALLAATAAASAALRPSRRS